MLALINSSQSLKAVDWFVQIALINRFLPGLKIWYSAQNDFNVLRFEIQPNKDGRIFKMEIKYHYVQKNSVQLFQPLLYCTNDDIVRHIDNHIFDSGSICYFYPADLSYSGGLSCLFAIQCATKWCDCYSYWEKNKQGGWPCKEMPHGSYHPTLFNINRPIL